MGGGKGLWCCYEVPAGPSTAHGTERPGCERWGLETKWISSLTVYLKEKRDDNVGLQNPGGVEVQGAPAGQNDGTEIL